MGLLNNFISGIPSLEGNELMEVFSHYLYMYNSCLCSLCFLISIQSPVGAFLFLSSLATHIFPSGAAGWMPRRLEGHFYGQFSLVLLFIWRFSHSVMSNSL